MNKTVIIVLLILLASVSAGNFSRYANAESINLNGAAKIDEDSNIFSSSNSTGEENKEKTQFRIKDSHDSQDSEFSLKGVITSSASDSIVIDNKTIKIDSSVTGNVKIIGSTNVGSYAMVKGIIKDSTFYAEKIIVDQRNKKDIEENENESPTPSISPTVTPTGTQSADLEEQENENINLSLGTIIESIQNFLNYLKDLAQKI